MSERPINKTYLKLYRSIVGWEWYSNSNTKSLFLHCLIMANYTDKMWQGKFIEKGSFITSLNHLALETGMSVSEIRTALENLKMTKEIVVKTTKTFTQIFVVKWGDYQGLNDDVSTVDSTEIAQQSQSVSKEIATTNKDKKDKKDKNKNKELCQEILDYLNLKSGRKFSLTKTHCSHINARIDEGHTIEDFKQVIEVMCDKWLKDSKMSEYIRPQTLFGTKFESYLNSKPIKKEKETSPSKAWGTVI